MNGLYKKALSDFSAMVETATSKQLEKAKIGFGISASFFASRYIKPKDNQKLYNDIYNIFYDYFNNI